jgi:hypothetical protein
MRKIFMISLALVLSGNIFAQDKGIGLGMIIGEPTGFSAKMWTGEKTALDAGIAWSFTCTGYLRVHSDLLWHNFTIEVDQGKLPVYYGVGAKLLLASNLGFGIRVPAGLAYLFDSAPVDIFAELVPGINFLPRAGFSIDAAIGARYYFKGQ